MAFLFLKFRLLFKILTFKNISPDKDIVTIHSINYLLNSSYGVEKDTLKTNQRANRTLDKNQGEENTEKNPIKYV